MEKQRMNNMFLTFLTTKDTMDTMFQTPFNSLTFLTTKGTKSTMFQGSFNSWLRYETWILRLQMFPICENLRKSVYKNERGIIIIEIM
jgi:hypothetical protein